MSMDYTLIRSRRRTLALAVTREAQVVVRAPLRCPQRRIDAFVESRRAWLEAALMRQKERLAAHPPLTEAEVEDLRRRAKAHIPGRVAHWAQRMGLAPATVKITSARTRFGSCSSKDTLCFSLYLMQYPPEAIDAVVVHELCHMRHRNHSPAFYAEVARWLPDYREREKLL
ncbi:MAG: M48 family metallopeptidase, partial [Oscillospiraceae bacterium]|nr:M48 family metallopeptidase [Oscillospiraceae bacterium]